MKEVKVKKLFNSVLYSPGRPKEWTITNQSIPYFICGMQVSRYQLEKTLKIFKNLDIPRVSLEPKGDYLYLYPRGKLETMIQKLKKVSGPGKEFK